MAVEAMRHGKHVAVEVPAATTIDECHQLVETAEATRRHCFMTENCCYDHFALSTLEMAHKGLLGEITHCEGAYIHNLRDTFGLTGNTDNTPATGWRKVAPVTKEIPTPPMASAPSDGCLAYTAVTAWIISFHSLPAAAGPTIF